jgi:hypothetical protein
MGSTTPTQRLARLFRRTPIADMPAVEHALPGRSRRSLYRDLESVGYVASFSHAGRFYTLRGKAPFDEEGLWIHQGIGFSRHGTLKATSQHLVEVSKDGRTHRELEQRLRVRVHNTLLALVHEEQIGRESVGPTYVYVSADTTDAAAQIQRRREHLERLVPAAGGLPSTLVVEVLVEIIRGAKAAPSSATRIARRLAARGIPATAAQVQEVLQEHGIGKKGRHTSRSRHSQR